MPLTGRTLYQGTTSVVPLTANKRLRPRLENNRGLVSLKSIIGRVGQSYNCLPRE